MTLLAAMLGAVLVLCVWTLTEVRREGEEDREVIAGFTPYPEPDEEVDEI